MAFEENSFGRLPRDSSPVELARVMAQIGAVLVAICAVAAVALAVATHGNLAATVAVGIAGLAGVVAVYGSRSVRSRRRDGFFLAKMALALAWIAFVPLSLAADRQGVIHILLGIVGLVAYTWVCLRAWRFVDRVSRGL